MKKGIAWLVMTVMLFTVLYVPVGAYAADTSNIDLRLDKPSAQPLPERVERKPVDGEVGDYDSFLPHSPDEAGMIDQNGLLIDAAKHYKDDEIVSAIVVLDGVPLIERAKGRDLMGVAMTTERKQLEKEQRVVEERLQHKLGNSPYTKLYNYTLLTNGIALSIEFGRLKSLADIEGVKYVYVAPRYEVEPNTVSAGEMINISAMWDCGYTGKGMKIAVIDTGVDIAHTSFRDAPDGASIGLDDISSELVAELHAAGEPIQLYRTPKIPFGYNYADRDLNVSHSFDNQSDHGTHVAGIIAANAIEGVDVVGVAPDAQLLVFKVFGASGGGLSTDIIAALEDAVLLGVDVVNMSFGAPAGFTNDDPELEAVLRRLSETDILASISAGNNYSMGFANNWGTDLNLSSNPDNGVIGSPSSFMGGTSVASVENAAVRSKYFEIAGEKIGITDSATSVFTEFYSALSSGSTYELAPVTGYGDTVDAFLQADVEGKIALISRGGGVNFTVKQANASAAGAVGVIVYNNVSGSFGMQVNDGSGNIPCVSISREDSEKLFDYISSGVTAVTIGTGEAFISNIMGYSLSDYSSWGVTSDLRLKPELTGVGGNIYSTLTNNNYGTMSGTSMAAPQVAGVAALVMQYLMERDDISYANMSLREYANALIMSSALPMESNGVKVTPRKQGSGLINAEYAINAGAYIAVAGSEKPKLELGDDPDRIGVYTLEFDIVNISGEVLRYMPDVSVLSEEPVYIAFEGYNAPLGFMSGTTIALEGAKVALSCEHDGYYMGDVNRDGYVGGDDALLVLRHTMGLFSLPMPSVADFDYNGLITTDDALNIFRMVILEQSSDYIEANTLLVMPNTSETVTAVITLTDENKAFLDEHYKNGMFVDGFVRMLSLGQSSDLTVPYLAFYGDWTEAPAIDSMDWGQYVNGEVPSFSQYLNIAWAKYSIDNMFIGENYFDPNGETTYIPDRNAISPNGDWAFDGLQDLYISMLRNARQLRVNIVDAVTGEQYMRFDMDYARKSCYSNANGFTVPTITSWYTNSSAPLWDGTDANGNTLPNNTKVIVRVEAELDVDGTAIGRVHDVWEFPLTIDVEAPEVTCSQRYVDGRQLMDISISDNQYAMCMRISSNETGEILHTELIDELEAGKSVSYTIDITDFGNSFMVVVDDYAANRSYTYIESETLAPATGIALSNDFLMLYTYTDGRALTASYVPNGLPATDLVFETSDESIAAVTPEGIVTGLAKGRAVITCSTSDGQYSAECVVQVGEMASMLQAFNIQGNWIAFDGYFYGMMEAGQVDFTVLAADVVGEEVYGYTSNMQFFQLNLWSGGTPTITPTPLNQQRYMPVDMTYDYTTETMFALASIGAERWLFKSNLSTGALTPLACITGAPSTIITLACDGSGQLYGVTIGDATLCSIDKYTGEATVIGSTGYRANYIQSMTFDIDNDVLYWAKHYSSDANLTVIDVQTGKAHALGRIGNGAELMGLTCASFNPPVPIETEPISGIKLSDSSIMMVAGGIKTLDAAVLPYNANDKTLTWTSSNEEAVGVLEDGTLLGFWFGTSTITATTADGAFSASCEVTVVDGEYQMYGFRTFDTDYTLPLSWVSFAPMNPTYVQSISRDDLELINCAEYYDGYVYGYDMYNRYFKTEFGVWNPVYTGAKSAGYMAMDMTFDYSTTTMYAVIDAEMLYKVDIDTGNMTFVAAMDCAPIYCLAATTEGELYGLSCDAIVNGQSSKLYRIDKQTGSSTLVGDTGQYMARSLQSMAYDHNNDVMYWAIQESNYTGKLLQIKLETGATTAMGTIAGNAQICGLFAQYAHDTVEVTVPAAAVTLSSSNLPMLVGDTEALTASVLPFNAQSKEVVWSTSDNTVVTVTEDGLVTAVAEGLASITATTVNNKTATCSVRVLADEAVMYGYRGYSSGGYYGDSFMFIGEDAQYWKSTGECSTINIFAAEYYDGTVYGFETTDDGATFQGFTENHITRQREYTGVTIYDVPLDMAFDYSTGAMFVLTTYGAKGRALQLLNLETGELQWYCTLSNCISMLTLGITTAGDAYGITPGDGGIGSALLYSIDKNSGVCSYIGNTGKNANFIQSMGYDHSNGVMYWAQYCTEPDSGLYAVELSNGKVTYKGKLANSAEVAGLYSVVTDIPTPELLPATGVMLNYAEGFLFEGMQEQLVATVLPVNAENKSVIWTSSNESVATVSDSGIVTGVATGEATITVTTIDGGFTASCEYVCKNYADGFMAYSANVGDFFSFDIETMPSISKLGNWSGRAASAAEYVDGYIYYVTVIERALYRLDMQGNREYIGPAGYVYDMAYHEATSTMYTVSFISGVGQVIAAMDLTTGTLTPLFSNTINIYALTVTNSGIGYIYTRLGDFGTIDLTTGETVLLGHTGLPESIYYQTMTYDEKNDVVYIGYFYSTNYSSLAAVDVRNGQSYDLGFVNSIGTQLQGLMCIYNPD